MAYPFIRYVSEGIASLLLVPLAAAIVFMVVTGPRIQVLLIRFAAGIAVFAVPVFFSLFNAEQSVIKYLLFCLTYIIIALVAIDFPFAKFERPMRWYTALFCLSLITFVIFPSLPQYDDQVYLTDGFQQIDSGRLRGIFPHANDLGIFAAALALFNLWRMSFSAKLFTSLDGALLAICALITAYSGSDSGIVVFLGGLVWRIFGDQIALNLLRIVLIVVSVMQLALFGWMQDALVSGSFWWRFHMAERVWEITPIVQLQPALIASQETWSHSLILDLLLIYGVFLTILTLAMLLIYTFICKARVGTAILIVVLPMCVQPPGALPASFMILVLAAASCVARTRGGGVPITVRSTTAMPVSRQIRAEY